MNIVLSGGGTAGHINPALAIAGILQDQGHAIYYAGTPQGVEARLVPEAGLSFTSFEAAGFNRNHPLTLVKALHLMSSSTKKVQKWFEEIQPDVVVCFGGYVCIAVGRAAQNMGIPVVVHEQNSAMGMTNKYLAGKAHTVALTYESAKQGVKTAGKFVLTGNPVRKSIFDATREQGRAYMGIPEKSQVLVVFGGSLGARHINTAVSALKDDLLAHEGLHIWHITGPKEYDAVLRQLSLDDEQAKRWHVCGYENKMGMVLSACDMVVARSGATSLAEISALGIPALLVPFPFATADHQTTNAREYVNAGAAYMVADSQVESDEFKRLLTDLIESEQTRQSMKEAAAAFGTRDAAAKLADVVLAAAR